MVRVHAGSQNFNNMNSGYKGMLRDRLLPSWNLALLWCKVKQRWVDCVYERNIARTPKPLRSEECKLLAGRKLICGEPYPFMSTVNPDGFLFGDDPEEYQMWRNVYKWVEWFSKNQAVIYSELKDICKQTSIFEIQVQLLHQKFQNLNEKLLRFMIKNKDIYYGKS